MEKILNLIFLCGAIPAVLSQGTILCYWRPSQSTLSNSDPSLCTHVTFAFVTVEADGTLLPQNLTLFKSLKDLYPDVKFLISLVGSFQNVSDSPALREALAENSLKYVQDNNLDGIDIDWEFPNDQAENLSLMIEVLWNTLHPRGYILTIATGVDNLRADSRYNIGEMTYNFHGSWQKQTGINSPLYSSIDTVIYTVDKAIQYFLKQIGNDTQKILMGIPLYGATWNLTTNNTGVGAPGVGAGISLRYYQICKNILSGWTRVFDDSQKAPYAYGDGMWVGYDDAESIQEKLNYVEEYGLGGVFYWEMAMDDSAGECGEGQFPLMTLVKNALIQEPQETSTQEDTTSTTEASSSSSSSSSSTTARADTTPSSAVRFESTWFSAVLQIIAIMSLTMI